MKVFALTLFALIVLAGCTAGGALPAHPSAQSVQAAQPTPTPTMATGSISIQ